MNRDLYVSQVSIENTCAFWLLSIQNKVFVRKDTRDVQKLNINSPTKVLMVNFNAVNVRSEYRRN